ncbi:MAG: GNAT family N-acetyltransferase [Chloroflexi bacterium]|nr:GNAT family N-acetyltransferase [Chloroflexota bacterium]
MDMKINHREYRGEENNQRVRELLSRNFAITRHPYYTIDPPNWERIRAFSKLDSNRQSIHLWELTDHPLQMLVGIVLYQKHKSEFSCLVDPDYREIENMLYDWVEKEHGATKTAPHEKQFLNCSVCEGNKVQKAILTRRGYTKGKLETVFRKRTLDRVGSETVLPKGYTIQEVQTLSEEQFTERAMVESQIFGGTITIAFLHELQISPIYRPELDLVIMAPNGSIAAFCVIWFDERHCTGYFEPIGTVAVHRRLGLGKMLMLEGFRRLHKMGATTVYLGNSADNSASNQLYELVGMSVFDQECLWQKEIRINY